MDKETILKKAIEETSWPKMAYPNQLMEDQCRYAFIKGAKWAIDELTKQSQFNSQNQTAPSGDEGMK